MAGNPTDSGELTIPDRDQAALPAPWRLVFDSVPAGIFIASSSGDFIYVNRHWTALTGLRAELARGTGWMTAVHPDDRASVIASWTQACQQSQPWQQNFRCGHQPAAILPIRAQAIVAHEPDSGATLYVGSFIEHSSSALQDGASPLQRIESRGGEQLARQQFLANMSQELRLSLNEILGLSTLVLQTTLLPEQREGVKTIQTHAASLLNVVNDILDFSRIEAGRIMVLHEPFSIRETVQRAVALLSARIKDKHIELVVDIHGGVPETCIGDGLRLGQVLTSLLNNAVKYTPAHGAVLVFVSAEQHSPEQIELKISVTDSGAGIDPATLQAIFEPFGQSLSSQTPPQPGAGLGLYIAKSLIQLMQGRIWAESIPTRGSAFHLSLPLGVLLPWHTETVQSGSSTAKAPVSGSISSQRPYHVLVVEDHEVNQRYIERALNKHGFLVTVLHDGQEALEYLERPQTSWPDAILMDCQMPVLDGYAASIAIRKREQSSDRRIPIVALTASAMDEDRTRCLAAGMDDYIAKPIEPTPLAYIMARWCEGGRKARTACEQPSASMVSIGQPDSTS